MSDFPGAQPSQPVDNPTQGATPAPAAEPGTTGTPAAAPAEPTTPPAQPAEPKVYQPGDPEALVKILEGADPEVLFGKKQPPAEPNPQEPGGEPNSPQGEPPEPGEPAEPRLEDQIPDKFKNPDGSINTQALMKSYLGMEKVLGEQGNKLSQMQQLQGELQQLREMITGMASKPAPNQAQPGQQPEPEDVPKFPWEQEMTPEEKEKWIEKFYEDPETAQNERDQQIIKAMEYRMNKMLEQAIKPLAPVVQSYQHNQQVTYFKQQIADFTKDGQHADFFDLQPEMRQIIEKYGDNVTKLPNAVEVIYHMAKGLKAPSGPPEPAPTFEDMLKDPQNVQKIVQNPEIKNMILQGYVKEVKDGQPPVTIGSHPGGEPPAAPPERPRSVREASSIFARFLNRGGTGQQ